MGREVRMFNAKDPRQIETIDNIYELAIQRIYGEGQLLGNDEQDISELTKHKEEKVVVPPSLKKY